MLIKIFIFAAALALSACAAQKWYYNQSVRPNEQQMFYDQDVSYCRGVSAGSVPIPSMNFSQSQGYRTYGTAQIYNASTGYTTVNYQSQTTPIGGFSSGFQQGWQIGDAMSAASRRNDVMSSCMSRLGWREIPCKTCTPVTQPKTTAEQLFERYLKFPDNKAFARGDNAEAGASWGAKSEEEAKLLAIRTCAESGGTKCRITDLNGKPQF